MNEKAYKVFPLKRITAGIYDFFLLLGVWFAVGSIALWLNGGETLNPWLGLSLVILSSWGFFAYFWLNGNKTLGMAVWNIEIYSLNGEKNYYKANFNKIFGEHFNFISSRIATNTNLLFSKRFSNQ